MPPQKKAAPMKKAGFMKRAAPVKKTARVQNLALMKKAAFKKQEASAKAKEPDTTVTRRKRIRNFKKFNELPIEIRYRIYKYASFPGRLVRAKWDSKTLPDRFHVSYMLEAGPVPTVLHLDKEARKEALKYFQQIPTSITFTAKEQEWPRKIYVNNADRICFTNFSTSKDILTVVGTLAKTTPITHLLFKDNLANRFISEKDHYFAHLPPKVGIPTELLFDLVMGYPGLRSIYFILDKTYFSEGPRPWNYNVSQFPASYYDTGISGSRRVPWYWDKLAGIWELVTEENCGRYRDMKKWDAFLKKNPEWVGPELGVTGVKCIKRL